MYNGFVWLLFIYCDGSVALVRTTLNHKLLHAEGVRPREDAVYDFSRRKYFSILDDKIQYVEEYVEKPVLKEVDAFANRFI